MAVNPAILSENLRWQMTQPQEGGVVEPGAFRREIVGHGQIMEPAGVTLGHAKHNMSAAHRAAASVLRNSVTPSVSFSW